MAPKKVIVIGGGIAGLSAGIYSRMNGFETHLFEAGERLGGVCQSWSRNGYTVNRSIHWLLGSGPGNEFFEMWRELGVIENTSFYHHNSFMEYVGEGGTRVHLFTDVDKLERHLLLLSPADADLIREWMEAIRTLSKYPLALPETDPTRMAWSAARFVLTEFPLLRLLLQWQPVTMRQFAGRFKHPAIKELLETFWHPEMSMMFFILQQAFANMGSASYPLGGSGTVIEKLFDHFDYLGGNLHMRCRVQKIDIENGQACGIVLSNGETHRADYVISTADAYQTLYQHVGKDHLPDNLKLACAEAEPSPGMFYFSAGVRQTFSEVPPSICGLSLPLYHPVKVGPQMHHRAAFQFYTFDPTLTATGQTLVTAMFPTDFEYWKQLRQQDLMRYQNERVAIVQAVLDNLEVRFPGLTERLDFADGTSPVSYVSESGHWGSYESWLPTPGALRHPMPAQLPEVKNLFFAGHWVAAGGGMPPAAFTARQAVQHICRQDGARFVTSLEMRFA
jgi:phytoene dehydrogenase-like protein